jgi:hypothetical protein
MIRNNRGRNSASIHTPRRRWLKFAGVFLAILSTVSFAGATPITAFGSGVFTAVNSSLVLLGSFPTSGCINWYSSGSAPTMCTLGTGNFSVQPGSDAPFTGVATGNISNLITGFPLPLVDFMVIDNAPNTPAKLHFDLRDILFNGATPIGGCSGAAAASPFDTCTPANSPFHFSNGQANPGTGQVDTVSFFFVLDAWGYAGSSGTNYNAANSYMGVFSGSVAGLNILSLLGTLADGGAVNAPWSAMFSPATTTAAPEPAPLVLLSTALTAIGLFRKRGVTTENGG